MRIVQLVSGEIKLLGDQLHLFLPFSLSGQVLVECFVIMIEAGPFRTVDTSRHENWVTATTASAVDFFLPVPVIEMNLLSVRCLFNPLTFHQHFCRIVGVTGQELL